MGWDLIRNPRSCSQSERRWMGGRGRTDGESAKTRSPLRQIESFVLSLSVSNPAWLKRCTATSVLYILTLEK